MTEERSPAQKELIEGFVARVSSSLAPVLGD